MREARITHPRNEPLIMIRKWQLHALDGNQCAAALLSLLEYWHNHKAAIREQDAAIGKNTSILQWHTAEELENGILNLYKRDSIRKALLLLEQKGFISIEINPIYGLDRTKFFIFNEEFTQAWINRYVADKANGIYISEKSQMDHKSNVLPICEKSQMDHKSNVLPICEKSQLICEKSSQQRLHAESTLGGYSLPSLTQRESNSPPRRDPARPTSQQSVSDLTQGVAIEPLDTASVPIENTFPLPVRDCADTHAAQGGLFASELPASDSKTTLGYRDTFSGDSVQPCPVSVQKRASVKTASRKKSTQTEIDPRATHPAIVAVREIRKQFPPKELWDEIIAIVGDIPDLERLRKCYTELLKRGSSRNAWYWAIDWYRDGVSEFGVKPKRQKEISKYAGIDFNKYGKLGAR